MLVCDCLKIFYAVFYMDCVKALMMKIYMSVSGFVLHSSVHISAIK